MNKISAYASEIVRLVSPREALELYGIEVSSKGFALCPFHSEKTASLKVYQDSFYCFGCGASGDVINLVQKLFGLKFGEAIKKLNTDFSLNLPIGERMTLRQAAAYAARKREIAEARRHERERKQKICEDYLALVDEYIRLESNFKCHHPTQGDEGLHPLFIESCQKLDYISYRLDTFDWEGGSAA